MHFTQQQEENQKFVNKLIEKAWEDADFKKRLVADPNKAIEEYTGKRIELPEGIRLVVNDQTDPRYLDINIPPKFDSDVYEDIELTDEQLEAVSGGVVGVGEVLVVVVVCGILGFGVGAAVGSSDSGPDKVVYNCPPEN